MLFEKMAPGLDAPICLTWEITYDCNLHCKHCLSSSGKTHQDELSTVDAKELIDQWASMQVFYINIGGGEPLSRSDFFTLMQYCLTQGIGVKVSTNGTLLDDAAARWIASQKYFDLQISLDGATKEINDTIRGSGSFRLAHQAMQHLSNRDVDFIINVVVTKDNFHQLDQFLTLAHQYSAQLRLSRLRPSGRGKQNWNNLRLTAAENKQLYHWLVRNDTVLTGDSFFHLSPYGVNLEGINFCSAGRVICAVNPIGEVYPCPFLLGSDFRAGNIRQAGGFQKIWQESAPFLRLRQGLGLQGCQSCKAYAQCHGGCLAAKVALGLDPESPDPDCIFNPPQSILDQKMAGLQTRLNTIPS
jgi:mycofactocin radical SAM maturase